jgi:outer membrane biogenesis lipoprotein LolB
MRVTVLLTMIVSALLLAACSGPAPRPEASTGTIPQASRPVSDKGYEVVM